MPHRLPSRRPAKPAAGEEPVGLVSCTVHAGPLDDEPRVSAPPQSGYPARFVAEVHYRAASRDAPTAAEQDDDLIVFVRPDAASPWAAVLDVSSANPGWTVGPRTSAALREPVPATSGAPDPHDVPRLLADYFQAWKDTGRPPADTPISNSGYPRTRGEAIARIHQDLISQGATDTTAYRSGSSDDGYYDFAARAGVVLACSTVRWTTNDEAGAASPLRQPADRSRFGPSVEPGDHRVLVMQGVRQACFSLTVDCTCLTVDGMNGGITTVVTDERV